MERTIRNPPAQKGAIARATRAFAVAALAATTIISCCKIEPSHHNRKSPQPFIHHPALAQDSGNKVNRYDEHYRILLYAARNDGNPLDMKLNALDNLYTTLSLSGKAPPEDCMIGIRELSDGEVKDLRAPASDILAEAYSKKGQWSALSDLLKSGDEIKRKAAMASFISYAPIVDKPVLEDTLRFMLSDIEASHTMSESQDAFIHNAVVFRRDISAVIPTLSRLALTRAIVRSEGNDGREIEVINGVDAPARAILVEHLAGHRINQMDWQALRKLLNSQDHLVSRSAAKAVNAQNGFDDWVLFMT